MTWWRNRRNRAVISAGRAALVMLVKENAIPVKFAVEKLDEILRHERTGTLPAWLRLDA